LLDFSLGFDPFSLLFGGVIFGLVERSSHLFSLFTGVFGILKLLFDFGLFGSLLLSLDRGGVLLGLGSVLLGLHLGRALGLRGLLSVINVLLFILFRDVGWVMASGVASVGADLCQVSLVICIDQLTRFHHLLVEVEKDDFDVLLGNGVADQLDGELLVRPVLTGQAVKDGTGVAVVFLQSLSKHALQKLLRKELVGSGIKFLIYVLLSLLSFLLFLGFSESILKFHLLLFKVLGSLVTHGVTTLLPVVDQLVDTDQGSLVLLSQEVASGGTSTGLRSKEDHVELLLVLERGWHLDLKLIGEHLSELRLKVTLDSREVVAGLRDFLLSLLRLLNFGPFFAFLILRILFAMLLSAVVLQELLFVGFTLLDLHLSCLDISLVRLDSAFIFVLFFY